MLMGVGFLIEIPSYQSLQVTGSVAAHRNTPQHTATHCNALQHLSDRVMLHQFRWNETHSQHNATHCNARDRVMSHRF